MKKKKIRESFLEFVMPVFLRSLKWHHQDIHTELDSIKKELIEVKRLVKENCV